MQLMNPVVVARSDFDSLFTVLRTAGFTVLGPTVRDQVITYAPLSSVEDLPIGWTDRQDGGRYELVPREDEALFGYALGQHSWKEYLYPRRTTLFEIRPRDGSFEFVPTEAPTPRYAFLGIRACELAAIGIQDRVFLGGGPHDRTYSANREGLFTIAVNCGAPGGTCFCVSMGTGPRAEAGYDLALTEVIEDGNHYFVFEPGSDAGASILAEVPSRPADAAALDQVEAILAASEAAMGRSMDTTDIKQMLQSNPDHPQWDEVAERCLACTNCTLVCPTCFCSTTEDRVALDTGIASRSRRWDSCFTMDFSNLHGTPVRESTRARYRQWMTHKLASWYDQFGTSGCVGCGRCITWCPVGIDITREAAAIRASEETVWT
jgi:sulfhydrogenase subunit beta (sulfur reductase)